MEMMPSSCFVMSSSIVNIEATETTPSRINKVYTVYKTETGSAQFKDGEEQFSLVVQMDSAEMAKKTPLLYNDKRFDILCMVHPGLDRLDVWERRRKQVKTFKYPGKDIILNYGTFLEEGDLFMITVKDRSTGKTQAYPLAFAFEKGTLAVPILNLSDCDISVPYSVCLGEDGPDAMEAFVPTHSGDKMMVKGMDVKNTEPSRVGSCDKLAKWSMHIPAMKQAAYEKFICT